ncbi:MAG TPA: hypothetical protein VK911_16125 [Vicinamibacterales bacterium]|nr:hypothetical protein [Vicinamibacterales bacterium]
MFRLNRAFLALALVAAFLAGTALATAQAAPATQTRAKFVDTVRGPADIQYLKPVTKREKDTIVTTIQIKNVSPKAIARLTIEEFWYDAGGNPVTGDKQWVKKPLMTGETTTIVLRTPVNPNMNRNSYKFSHANGDVKPKQVSKFEQ